MITIKTGLFTFEVHLGAGICEVETIDRRGAGSRQSVRCYPAAGPFHKVIKQMVHDAVTYTPKEEGR